MNTLNYYTAAVTREIDRLAIEEYNSPGIELMQRAANATYIVLVNNWPNVKKIIVLCGTGNNGGDGFIIASLAKQSGIDVELFVAGDSTKISGDAKTALHSALSNELNIIPTNKFNQLIKEQNMSTDTKAGETVIIDALLGTGLSGEVREPYTDLINDINASPLPVLSIDIPSGLCSDTGKVLALLLKRI